MLIASLVKANHHLLSSYALRYLHTLKLSHLGEIVPTCSGSKGLGLQHPCIPAAAFLDVYTYPLIVDLTRLLSVTQTSSPHCHYSVSITSCGTSVQVCYPTILPPPIFERLLNPIDGLGVLCANSVLTLAYCASVCSLVLRFVLLTLQSSY